MDNLNSYLEQATKGLWGRKKQEVWQELEANLKLRIQDLQVQGLTPEDATRVALNEMGRPDVVSMEMQRIYTLPRLGLAFLTALVLTGLSLVWLNQARAQTEPVLFGFFSFDSRNAELTPSNGVFEASVLADGLKRLGVGVKQVGKSLEFSVPGKPTFRVSVGEFTIFGRINETNKTIDRVLFSDFIAQAARAGLSPRLEGWDTGKLKLDNLELTLWKTEQANFGYAYPIRYSVYAGLIRNNIQAMLKLPFSATGFGSNPGCKHVLEVKDSANQVYALVSAIPMVSSQSADSPKFRRNAFDVAVADSTGKLEFRIGTGKLEFTTDPSRIKPEATTGAEPVMLMKVTGEFKDGNLVLQPVMPSKPTSQNVPGTCF